MAQGSLKGCFVVGTAFLAPALLYLASLPAPADTAPAEIRHAVTRTGVEPLNPERRYVRPLTEDIMYWRRPIADAAVAEAAPPAATENPEAPKTRAHKTASRSGQSTGQRKREAAASARLVQNDFGWQTPQTP